MSAAPVLCIDGPSGVGKGTVARGAARALGWRLLDSGALYRILALAARDAGTDLADGAAVAALAGGLDIGFDASGDDEAIQVNGQDRTREVRDEGTAAWASEVAVHPEVRAALLTRQRAFRAPPGLVADGRDMGTVVFPDAPVKVFLEASPEERARRRLRQLRAAGQTATLSSLCADIRERDVRDRNRPHSPLVPAADAAVIDTTDLPAEAVLDRVLAMVRARGCAT